MNSGLNDYESLVNSTGNEYLEQDLAALEVQIIALQVEETRNYKLNGSKQMDNGYTPTDDYDLITLKFFLEHNIITMSFLRTDGGNAMLADITMESINEIDINGCRAISNQNTESKVNYQTFDYRTILQNGYYTGNTINDWVGNNSIIISHKDGKVTINEATIDFSNNQIVNFSQLNNITAAEVATLAGSDTNTTLQTQINDGMTEIGNLTAEVLNLDNEFKILDSKAIKQGNNTLTAPFSINNTSSNDIIGAATSFIGTIQQTLAAPNMYVGDSNTNYLTLKSGLGTAINTGGPFSISSGHGMTVSNSFQPITVHSDSAGISFTTTNSGSITLDAANNLELRGIGTVDLIGAGSQPVNITSNSGNIVGTTSLGSILLNAIQGSFITEAKDTLIESSRNLDIKTTSGPITITTTNNIDFKTTQGHLHVDAKNINLVAADQVQVEANEMTISSVINYLPLIVGGFSRDIAAKLAYYYLESSFLNTGPFAFHHTFIFNTPQQFQISQVFLQPISQINYYDNVVGKNILLGPNNPILNNSLDLTPLVGPVSNISNIKITLSVKLQTFGTAQIPDGLFFVRFYDINSNIGYESRGFNVGAGRSYAPTPIYLSGTETLMYQLDNTFTFFTIWYQPNTSTSGNNYQMCINLSFKIERF